jgi:hypothetical protein
MCDITAAGAAGAILPGTLPWTAATASHVGRVLKKRDDPAPAALLLRGGDRVTWCSCPWWSYAAAAEEMEVRCPSVREAAALRDWVMQATCASISCASAAVAAAASSCTSVSLA